MTGRDHSVLSRRQVLAAGATVAAGWVLDAGWLTEAHAQAATFESHPRYRFADVVADIVLPATDTPGASAAKVGGFLLFALERGMSGLSLVLLERVHAALDRAAGGAFLDQPAVRRSTLLAALDERAYADTPASDSAEQAWRRIKGVVLAGYYTSEIGASQELVYEPVPGRFTNIKLTPDFRNRSNEVQGGTL